MLYGQVCRLLSREDVLYGQVCRLLSREDVLYDQVCRLLSREDVLYADAHPGVRGCGEVFSYFKTVHRRSSQFVQIT